MLRLARAARLLLSWISAQVKFRSSWKRLDMQTWNIKISKAQSHKQLSNKSKALVIGLRRCLIPGPSFWTFLVVCPGYITATRLHQTPPWHLKAPELPGRLKANRSNWILDFATLCLILIASKRTTTAPTYSNMILGFGNKGWSIEITWCVRGGTTLHLVEIGQLGIQSILLSGCQACISVQTQTSTGNLRCAHISYHRHVRHEKYPYPPYPISLY